MTIPTPEPTLPPQGYTSSIQETQEIPIIPPSQSPQEVRFTVPEDPHETTRRMKIITFVLAVLLVVAVFAAAGAATATFKAYNELGEQNRINSELRGELGNKDKEIQHLRKELENAQKPRTIDGLRNDTERFDDGIRNLLPDQEQRDRIAEQGGDLLSGVLHGLAGIVDDARGQ